MDLTDEKVLKIGMLITIFIILTILNSCIYFLFPSSKMKVGVQENTIQCIKLVEKRLEEGSSIPSDLDVCIKILKEEQ